MAAGNASDELIAWKPPTRLTVKSEPFSLMTLSLAVSPVRPALLPSNAAESLIRCA